VSILRRVIAFREAGCTSIKDMVGALTAEKSLFHVQLVGTIAGWLARRPLAWNRTSKFKVLPAGLRIVGSAWWETIRSVVILGVGTTLLLHASFSPADFVFLSSVYLLIDGCSSLSAPLMAFLAERGLGEELSAESSRDSLAGESPAVASSAEVVS
jgi:hypothetical protein